MSAEVLLEEAMARIRRSQVSFLLTFESETGTLSAGIVRGTKRERIDPEAWAVVKVIAMATAVLLQDLTDYEQTDVLGAVLDEDEEGR